MAATTGLELASSTSGTGRLGCARGLPNWRMSAPAMKLRPAPIMTTALTAGSLSAFSRASMMPSRTPGPSALTGGLSMVMTPVLPSTSNRTKGLSSAAFAMAFCLRRFDLSASVSLLRPFAARKMARRKTSRGPGRQAKRGQTGSGGNPSLASLRRRETSLGRLRPEKDAYSLAIPIFGEAKLLFDLHTSPYRIDITKYVRCLSRRVARPGGRAYRLPPRNSQRVNRPCAVGRASAMPQPTLASGLGGFALVEREHAVRAGAWLGSTAVAGDSNRFDRHERSLACDRGGGAEPHRGTAQRGHGPVAGRCRNPERKRVDRSRGPRWGRAGSGR